MEVFRFHQEARRPTTAYVVASIWVLLVLAHVFLDAALWVLAIVWVFTLPALLDLIRNPAAGLSLDQHNLEWYSGRRRAVVALNEIDHIRLDTRLDFSVRASVVLQSGRKIRMPFEATPPHRAFEKALEDRQLKVERHHFQLVQ